MKVLVAGTLSGQGGIQSHIRWLAKALGDSGFTVMVVSLGKAGSTPVDELSLRQIWNENVALACCAAYQNASASRGLSGIRRLQEVSKIIDDFNPDIYLAVGAGWNLFIPPLLSRARPLRIFHEVTSGIPEGWKDSRWCVKLWFDEVVGQSNTVAQTFSTEFGWGRKIETLPAFPEPLEVTASIPRVEKKSVPKMQAKAALFSRLVPHKQAFWLVQQWDTLKAFLAELHIHGSGAEESLIRRYIAEREISDRVKCFGRYPEGDSYVDLLRRYDLTLLPTIGAEGAPLVLLESMACGVPFLAYGVGGIADYGINNPDVSVVEPSRTEFFKGLEDLTHSLACSTIDQARLQKFYLAHYSYSALKEKWIRYLEKKFETAMLSMHTYQY